MVGGKWGTWVGMKFGSLYLLSEPYSTDLYTSQQLSPIPEVSLLCLTRSPTYIFLFLFYVTSDLFNFCHGDGHLLLLQSLPPNSLTPIPFPSFSPYLKSLLNLFLFLLSPFVITVQCTVIAQYSSLILVIINKFS